MGTRNRVQPTNLTWADYAACSDAPTEIFFPWPVGTHNEDPALAEAAKVICRTCPVRQQCLDEAIALRDHQGVRGGLTPREQRRLARQGAA